MEVKKYVHSIDSFFELSFDCYGDRYDYYAV